MPLRSKSPSDEPQRKRMIDETPPPAWWVRLGRLNVGWLIWMACLGLVWIIDLLMVEARDMQPSTTGFTVAAAVGSLFLILGLLCGSRSLKRWIALLAIYAIFLAGLTSIKTSRDGRVKDAYRAIQVGMTKEQVRVIVDNQLVAKHFPVGSPPLVEFGPDHLHVEFGSELGDRYFDISFKDGVVVRKQHQ